MSPQHPTHIAVVLFPGFQLLDVTGPLDALNMLSQTHTLRLSILAASLSPISTAVSVQSGSGSAFAQSLVPTHTFAAPPAGIEVLIVPGGLGCREESIRGPVVEFLRGLGLNEGARKSEGAWGEGQLKWVLTVCTGSMIVAETGALDGRRATTNKKAFNEVKAQFPAVNWVSKARWVVDGQIWTSSGISAGIDVTFAWIGAVFGEEVAQLIADRSEYQRNVDPENDLYARRWGAV